MASTATTSVATPVQTTAPAPVTATSVTTTSTAQATAASTQPIVTPATAPVVAATTAQPTVTSTQSKVTPTTATTQPVVTPATSPSVTSVVTAAATQPSVTSQVTSTRAAQASQPANIPVSAFVPSSYNTSAFSDRMSNSDTNTLYESPWAKTINFHNNFETRAELKDAIENYEPLGDMLTDEFQFPLVNILLFGSVGAGKSSVFNTINSIFRGKIFNVARSGNAEHSLTTKFSKYPVMSSGRTIPKPLNFRICDIRGLEQDHLMSKENMRLLLEGHVMDKFPFDPSGTMSADMPGFKRRPELHEKIHCVVIVQDATIVDAMHDLNPEVSKNIKDMQVVMNSLDIPQVVLLTKIDSVCEKTKNNIADVFHSPLVERCVSKASEALGLPRNCIFPLKNYEIECELDENIDVLTLFTIKKILDNCDAHLFNHFKEIQENYGVQNRRKP